MIKKNFLIFLIAVSVCLPFFTSIILDIVVGDSLLNTVLTIVGILFSIGMSLVVTFNDTLITKTSRVEIREVLNLLRIRYSSLFISSILVNIVLNTLHSYKYKSFTYDIRGVEISYIPSHAVLLFMIVTLFVFYKNMCDIQRLNRQITDKREEEQEMISH